MTDHQHNGDDGRRRVELGKEPPPIPADEPRDRPPAVGSGATGSAPPPRPEHAPAGPGAIEPQPMPPPHAAGAGAASVPPPPVYPPSGPYGPDRPPRPPAEPRRALAVALLNASGLGIGYLLLRRWAETAVCLAVTAAFVYLVLPADPDGLPTSGVVVYVLFLALAAADGFRRGLRAPVDLPLRPLLAVLLGLALLAVPAGGAVAYESARKEAVEEMLFDRLGRIDRTVEAAAQKAFDAAEPQYTDALDRYAALLGDHPGSRAAALVPERLDEYYDAVSAPYREGDHCGAVDPLTYLRTVPPEKIGASALGELDDRPDKPLAASLYACGVSRLGTGTETGGGDLGILLDTFPGSEEAARVRPALEDAVALRVGRLDEGEPCSVTAELRLIGETAGQLPQSRAGEVDDVADRAVEDGTFACGLDQFAGKKFADAGTTLTGFQKSYPGSARTPRARQIVIAAQIAAVRAQAGRKLPPAKAPGGARMEFELTNDAAGTVEVLYTGPLTGTLKIKGCGGCLSYRSESLGRANACKVPGQKYARKTLRLPAGEYHFLYKRAGGPTVRDHSSGARIQPGYTYTDCLFVVEDDPLGDLLTPPLPDFGDLTSPALGPSRS